MMLTVRVIVYSLQVAAYYFTTVWENIRTCIFVATGRAFIMIHEDERRRK